MTVSKKPNYTTEFCKQFAKERGGKFLSKKFLGYNEKHLWKCKDPTHPPFSPHFFNMVIRGTWCKTCRHHEGSTKALGISDHVWAKRCQKVGLTLVKVIRKINHKTQLEVKCNADSSHDHIKIADTVKSGTGCRFCKKRTKLTIEDAHKLAKSRKGFCLSKKYVNANSKLLWQCLHKHAPWPATYGQVKGYNKRAGTWCKECSSGIGERICRAHFEQIFNKKFPTAKPACLKPKGYMHPLELDGYCEELKLAFEHQGRYHFESIKFFENGNAKSKIKDRDRLKRALCKKNGITLVEVKEIPYLQSIATLKDFIKKACQKNKIKLPDNFDSIEVDLTRAYIHIDKHAQLAKDCEERNKILISDTYLGSQQTHIVQCKTCNHQWPLKPGNLRLGRGCPKCRDKKRISSSRIGIKIIK